MIEKLKQRWNLKTTWDVVAVLIVFSINGSFAVWVTKPVTAFFGVSPETMNFYLYKLLKFILIFPIYQITLPVVGWFFGKFKWFWEFEKKFLNRMGLGFIFRK